MNGIEYLFPDRMLSNSQLFCNHKDESISSFWNNLSIYLSQETWGTNFHTQHIRLSDNLHLLNRWNWGKHLNPKLVCQPPLFSYPNMIKVVFPWQYRPKVPSCRVSFYWASIEYYIFVEDVQIKKKNRGNPKHYY